MRVMSREFTTTEKILLVILAVLLVCLLYYKFIFQTTNSMIQDMRSQADTAQAELDVAKDQLNRLNSMQKELDDLALTGDTSRMGSYNSSKRETAFLNQALQGVSDYSITFSDITRNGNQIRRSFALQFVTSSYKEATDVVDEIADGEYRCLVDDINYSLADNDEIHINLTATFFETMVGGTADSALPPDSSDENTDGSASDELANDFGVTGGN